MHKIHGEGLGILDFFPLVSWTKIFDMVVSVIILAWSPVVSELVSILVVMHEPVFYVGWLGFFWMEVFVTNPNDVVLYVWIGVGGCLWTISSTVVHAGINYRELIYCASISASAAEVITFLWFLKWSRLPCYLLGLLRCSTWKHFHQICSSVLVWSGSMHRYALLEPCRLRCRTIYGNYLFSITTK